MNIRPQDRGRDTLRIILVRGWVALVVASIGACAGHDNTQRELMPHGEATGAATTVLPDIAWITTLPAGPLAGDVVDRARSGVNNPYQGNETAIQEGHRLFIRMNCAYCHGFDGSGGMGPSLQGNSWRFGGDDADVFKTIYGGRGKGMPAWGAAITEDDIWKLVAYIRTLGEPSVRGRRSEEAREPMKSVNEWEP